MKLAGGVNTNETMALNENGGISQSNLIRFFYDPNGITLVQKLGGWEKFFATPLPTTVAYMWAWEDLNSTGHLAVGTESVTADSVYAQLSVITNGTSQVITPTSWTSSPTLTAQTTAGSAQVLITDTTLFGVGNVAGGASVFIATPIAIGGLILSGQYPITANTSPIHTYFVTATDILGNAVLATSSSFSPLLPVFTTISGLSTVTVTLPGYTYGLGDSFAVLVSTTVGGIVLYGNYIITALIDSSHFSIAAQAPATSSATGTLNGGDAHYIYDNPVAGVDPTVTAIDWTMDNFGQVLIACYVQSSLIAGTYQPIYQWSPGTLNAIAIPEAPVVNDGILVAMPQRQIMAWGSTETGIQDPLLINWCDVNNPFQWIALVVNQAGSYRIPKGSRIVGGLQGPQQTLFWTDIDLWAAQYIGPPDIYGFNEIGSGCGLIARHAAAAANGIIYWMGPSQFFTLSGNGVQPLPCPVWDVIFQNMNQSLLTNIRVGVNSRFNEIQWFFSSSFATASQNDSYVKYNYLLNLWDYSIGGLRRSAWIDQSVLGPPIGAEVVSTFLLMQHDVPGVNDANGAAMFPSFQTGYYSIAEGDFMTFVDLVWPDMKWGYFNHAQAATVQITFSVANYPGDTPTVYGPFSVTQATEYFNTRFRGRLVSVGISSSDVGSFWRTGALRYRYAQDGKF